VTPEELINLKKLIAGVAVYYRDQLSNDTVAMYARDLQDLDFPAVLRAYEIYRKDPKNTKPPLPARIREMVKPTQQTDDVIAREAVTRLLGAIPKYGHTNAGDARKFMGELAWQIVAMVGGWSFICHEMGVSLHAGTCAAHWKELAVGLLQKARMGTLDTPPALPQPVNANVRSLAAKTVKEIPE